MKYIALNKSNIAHYQNQIPKNMRFCAAIFLEVPRSYIEQLFAIPMEDLDDDLGEYQQLVLKIDEQFVILELNDYPYLNLSLRLADETTFEQRQNLINQVEEILALKSYWVNDLSIIMK